jgi:hypothetical protein
MYTLQYRNFHEHWQLFCTTFNAEPRLYIGSEARTYLPTRNFRNALKMVKVKAEHISSTKALGIMRVYRFWQRCNWGLRSSGMCHCVTGWLDISTVQDESNRLYRNVRHQSPSEAASHPRRTETSTNELRLLTQVSSEGHDQATSVPRKQPSRYNYLRRGLLGSRGRLDSVTNPRTYSIWTKSSKKPSLPTAVSQRYSGIYGSRFKIKLYFYPSRWTNSHAMPSVHGWLTTLLNSL